MKILKNSSLKKNFLKKLFVGFIYLKGFKKEWKVMCKKMLVK